MSAQDDSMPQDVAAERAILSAMVSDQTTADDVLASGISADDFYRPANQVLYATMAAMRAENSPLDHISLRDRLRSDGDLAAAGGEMGIVDLDQGTPLSSWRSHVEIVRRLSVARSVIKAGAALEGLGKDGGTDTDELRSRALDIAFGAVGDGTGASIVSPHDSAIANHARLAALGKGTSCGIGTGFRGLDGLIGGLKPGQLVVLAARTSMGKTALAAQMAVNAADRGARAVAIFELEMGRQELLDRMTASGAGIPMVKFQRDLSLTDAEMARGVEFDSWLDASGIWIDDDPGTTVASLSAASRRAFRDVGAGQALVVVDYLNLMGTEGQRAENRQVEVAAISRGLKRAAKSLGQPVLALAQLNRSVESRPDRTPLLSDLRESGAIEQDADIVMFLDRSRTPEEGSRDGRPDFGTADLIIAKNRNGGLGTAHLAFDEATASFRDLAQ